MRDHTATPNLRRVVPVLLVLLAVLITGGIALAGVPAGVLTIEQAAAPAQPKSDVKTQGHPTINTTASTGGIGGGVTATPTSTPGCSASAVWLSKAVYPIPILDEALASQGTNLYAFAGVSNGTNTADAYKYDSLN